MAEYKKWSEWYLKTFSKDILTTILTVLSHYTTEARNFFVPFACNVV